MGFMGYSEKVVDGKRPRIEVKAEKRNMTVDEYKQYLIGRRQTRPSRRAAAAKARKAQKALDKA